MSKFNILIGEIKGRYSEWLQADSFNYYYFFGEKTIPTDEQITHIQEKHNNKITEHVEFGYFRLYNQRKKIEKQGYAMRVSGNYRGSGYFWPHKKLKQILNEPKYREKVFETVIAISQDYGEVYCGWAGWNYEFNGWIKMEIEYKIYKRSKSEEHRDDFDYFDIKEGEDPEKFIPNVTDKTTIYSKYKIIQYTKEAHEILKMICSAAKNLGSKLETLLSKDELKIQDTKLLTFTPGEENEN